MTDIFNGRRDASTDLTFRNLRDRYGYERACEIIDGKDEATNRDIAAWNAMGAMEQLRVAGVWQ